MCCLMGFYGVFHRLFYCIIYLIAKRVLGIGSVSDSVGDLLYMKNFLVNLGSHEVPLMEKINHKKHADVS